MEKCLIRVRDLWPCCTSCKRITVADMAQREVETLSPEECFALLGQTSIGRLVYQDEEGPVAVPVNFALAEGDIVIRVEGGIKRAAMSQRTLGLRGGPHR